jgi:purine-nucleoside phosphorylase
VNEPLAAALAAIRARKNATAPKVALVLGSGLGGVAEGIDERLIIPTNDLPDFPRMTVEGHAGDLVLGRLGGCEVAALTGRSHYYETGRADGMSYPLRVLYALGCKTLILTNAAASLRPEVGPGSLVLITDHINLGGPNPLIGRQDQPRFLDLAEAYDPVLRARIMSAAAQQGIVLHQGVYMWFSGPSFETPAEIRAARVLGAEVVGMSTVPETILARQCGFKVLAISVVTNLGTGLDLQPPDHRHTLELAAEAAATLTRLLDAFLRGTGP